MAPESLKVGVYSHKTDVWAFGITAIEVVTRALPFSDLPNQGFALDWKRMTENITALVPDLPQRLKSLICSCLNYHPDDRISSEELNKRLQSVELAKVFNNKKSLIRPPVPTKTIRKGENSTYDLIEHSAKDQSSKGNKSRLEYDKISLKEESSHKGSLVKNDSHQKSSYMLILRDSLNSKSDCPLEKTELHVLKNEEED